MYISGAGGSMRPTPKFRFPIWVAVLVILVAGAPSAAQSEPAAASPKKLPPPETLALRAKDQVQVHAVYYPGTEGKRTVPVILLHGWDGPRGVGSGIDCLPLAERLQKAGHAVIVPDLRGHGRTTRRGLAGAPDGTLDRDAFRVQDFRDMQYDVEAAKSHLLQKNNEGELNIELLCLVGFDMGAVVGLNWIRYDWSVPPLPILKQGQDVKAFVLVSPEQSFRGLPIQAALEDRAVRAELSAMVMFGQQQPNAATAGRRIFNTLKRSHREIPTDPKERERLQDLFLVELDTSLQGTKLLTSSALKVPERIEDFIRLRLVNRADQFPWQDRSLP
jgi:pimeloyl-ACP methyl ester carboxylesterase